MKKMLAREEQLFPAIYVCPPLPDAADDALYPHIRESTTALPRASDADLGR